MAYQASDLAEPASAALQAPGAPGLPGLPVTPGKLTAVAFAAAATAAALALEPTDPTALEQAQLASAAAPAWADLVDQVGALVAAAPDLATLQRTLTNAYGGLDTDKLTELMTAAFALAHLKGMVAVRDQAGG